MSDIQGCVERLAEELERRPRMDELLERVWERNRFANHEWSDIERKLEEAVRDPDDVLEIYAEARVGLDGVAVVGNVVVVFGIGGPHLEVETSRRDSACVNGYWGGERGLCWLSSDAAEQLWSTYSLDLFDEYDGRSLS